MLLKRPHIGIITQLIFNLLALHIMNQIAMATLLATMWITVPGPIIRINQIVMVMVQEMSVIAAHLMQVTILL